MADKHFSLLREGWIPTMSLKGEMVELSLLEVFDLSPSLRGLVGELPTLDFALLRLLLAVLHASLGKQPVGGYPFLPGEGTFTANPGNMMKRWKRIWDSGSFPLEVIRAYLEKHEDRFWLFHPVRPFFQVPEMDKATEYSCAKLNGVLAESSNKTRLFPQRTGEEKTSLNFPEAARWLIYTNGFDDTSAKPKEKGLPSPGAGWLGKLGPIWANGDNLFETLMLNFVLLPDGGNRLWDVEKPSWEPSAARQKERCEYIVPDNQSEILTLQSRRLLLREQDGSVVGYALLGGDFFPPAEEIFAEQMTVWRRVPKKEPGKREYPPRRHDPSRQLWRDFASLTVQGDGQRRPGIVSWLARMHSEGFLDKAKFSFQTACLKFGDKDFFADDIFGDSLTFSAELLKEKGDAWISRIVALLQWTDELVGQLANLSQQLAKASGDDQGLDARSRAREQAYYLLDIPFRNWLAGIDPEQDDLQDTCDLWQSEAKQIIRDVGRRLVEQAGPKALIGRTLRENNRNRRYTAAEAFNQFLKRTG